MKKQIQLLLILLSLCAYIGCATSQEEDPFSEEEETVTEQQDSNSENLDNSDNSDNSDTNSSADDFAQGEEEIMSDSKAKSEEPPPEDLLTQEESSAPIEKNKELGSDPLLEEDVAAQQNNLEQTEQPPSDAQPEISSPAEDKLEMAQAEPPTDTESEQNTLPAVGVTGSTKIQNIRFEGADGAGTVVIESTQPVTYTSRFNNQTQQYIIELSGVTLPDSLKRPYTTKDFKSDVGSIDAYQNPGSDVVKIVVQLREGAQEPTIQQEGNKILVIAGGNINSETEELSANDYDLSNSNEADASDSGAESLESGKGILSSANLQEFLSSNMKFYGKKISLEVKDISVRDAINLIAEESGANLVMTDSVNGNLSLKLRKVPWDQALVMVLRAKKLGYTRQGNVLRITDISEIKQEEDDAYKFAESKRKIDPLIVQMIPINYAKIDELKTQVSTVLSERGKVVADSRTSAMIITDTEEVLDRVKKMISGLDIPPAQILIEGKIVEANESFEKSVGIQWGTSGQDKFLAKGNKGPINLTPTLSMKPGIKTSASMGIGLKIGNLNLLGDLNSLIALEEREDNVKVISSPRIMTLHNVKASIVQGSQIPIIVGGAVTNNANLNTRTRDVVYKTLQMHLNVTPQVANNGNVIMNVEMKRDFPGAVSDDESGAAPIFSREAQTTVMVQSGQTAVIGGIYQNDARSGEGGVPWLKDIPVLGFLFRNENQSKNKTELLLFLTPRVLKSAEDQKISEDNTNSGTQYE